MKVMHAKGCHVNYNIPAGRCCQVVFLCLINISKIYSYKSFSPHHQFTYLVELSRSINILSLSECTT